GSTVTITGTNFTGIVSVLFGGIPATTVTINSPTQITVTVPPLVAGLVAIIVINQYGASPASTAGQFTCLPPAPTVTSVNPSGGPVAGGNTVTISGTKFTGATEVYFGDDAATFTVV